MTDNTGKYSVITFGTNQLNYVHFAFNCALSILEHNDIPVYIVTNLDFHIPVKYRGKISIIKAKPEHAALGIGIKLYIDQYAQTEHTLFIDSDCICFGDLGEIFKACEGMDVSVAGNIVPTESWCGAENGKTIRQEYGTDNIIRFNGGLYYIKKSALSKKIFDKAREIAERYDELKFARIRDKWMNEEGPLGVAMMMYGQKPIADDGRYMTDLYTDHRPRHLNVLTGKRSLRNPAAPHHKHRPWYPEKFAPIVLHFGGSNIKSYPYKSQSFLLKLKDMHLPVFIASAIVNAFIHIPYKSYHWLTGLSKK